MLIGTQLIDQLCDLVELALYLVNGIYYTYTGFHVSGRLIVVREAGFEPATNRI